MKELDNSNFKVWTWKHPNILLWMLNPIMLFKELLLGQRKPKVLWIEKKSNKPLPAKTWIPCPHCNTLHSNLKWTPQNNTEFKNWFGLYCDHCGGTIPCVRNLWSGIILLVTAPIWYWFRTSWNAQWLETQRKKFSQPLSNTLPDYDWWYEGLRWAVTMYIFMVFLFPLLLKENITLQRCLIGIPVWIVAGLLYGIMVKKMNRVKKQEEVPA